MRGKWHDEAHRALWASGTEKTKTKNKAAVSVRVQSGDRNHTNYLNGENLEKLKNKIIVCYMYTHFPFFGTLVLCVDPSFPLL